MHDRRLALWVLLLLATVVASVAGDHLVATPRSVVLLKLFHQTLVRYAWLFVLGCLVAEFDGRIVPLLSKSWWVLLLLGAVPKATGVDVDAGYGVLWCILMVGGVVGFAFRFPFLQISLDISYGLFLYHMIVVNAFVANGWTGTWRAFLAALSISCMLAYISAVTVGRLRSNARGRMRREGVC